MVPGTVGQTAATGNSDITEVNHCHSGSVDGHLEQRSGPGRTVLQDWLIRGRSLEPKRKRSTGGSGNSLVSAGKGIIIGSVQGQGITKLTRTPIVGSVGANQHRSVGTRSAS